MDNANAPTWHAVRVYLPASNGLAATVFEDAVLGYDQAEAEANARRNWINGTPATPAERIEYLGPDFEIDDRVRSLNWHATAGRISRRMEPGDPGNEDDVNPRLFVRWDGVAVEYEVFRDEITHDA